MRMLARQGWDEGVSFGFRRGFCIGGLCGMAGAAVIITLLTELIAWAPR